MTKSNYAACNSLLQAVKRALRPTELRWHLPTQSRRPKKNHPKVVLLFLGSLGRNQTTGIRILNTKNRCFIKPEYLLTVRLTPFFFAPSLLAAKK